MKHKILSMLGAGLLILTISSCHGENDTLMSYNFQDNLAFREANNSYAGKFKVLWDALNQNYALWDYERENGVDWDAVYDEYLPQFEALDNKETVTDSELEALLTKLVAPLHDGHMSVELRNHKTNKIVDAEPGEIRVTQRPDYESANPEHLTMKYYLKKENGEIVFDEEGNPDYMEADTRLNNLLTAFKYTERQGLQWINDSIAVLEQLTLPTADQVYMLRTLKELKGAVLNLTAKLDDIKEFNSLANRYAYLSIPGFTPIDTRFDDYGIAVRSALMKGNIAYFGFSNFNLTAYVSEDAKDNYFPNADDQTLALVQQVANVWNHWHQNIQRLHNNGQLGGVIIDLRCNGGGFQSDYSYVLGSLLPAGDFTFGKVRFKRGTGRLDYSPVLPLSVQAMNTEHAVVTAPIVVLTNCRSISMAEVTALSAKVLQNGRVIGKHSWGGLCGLIDNSQSSYNYSGHIGIKGETPVYVYLPTEAVMTSDGEFLEGVGITPDIDVDLDLTQIKATGKDTQLDRALQYIRNGN